MPCWLPRGYVAAKSSTMTTGARRECRGDVSLFLSRAAIEFRFADSSRKTSTLRAEISLVCLHRRRLRTGNRYFPPCDKLVLCHRANFLRVAARSKACLRIVVRRAASSVTTRADDDSEDLSAKIPGRGWWGEERRVDTIPATDRPSLCERRRGLRLRRWFSRMASLRSG